MVPAVVIVHGDPMPTLDETVIDNLWSIDVNSISQTHVKLSFRAYLMKRRVYALKGKFYILYTRTLYEADNVDADIRGLSHHSSQQLANRIGTELRNPNHKLLKALATTTEEPTYHMHVCNSVEELNERIR